MTVVDEIVTVFRIDDNDLLEGLRNLDATSREARRELEQLKGGFIDIKDELLDPIKVEADTGDILSDEQKDGINVPVELDIQDEPLQDAEDTEPQDIDIDLNTRNASSTDTLNIDPQIKLPEQPSQTQPLTDQLLPQPTSENIVDASLQVTEDAEGLVGQVTNIQNLTPTTVTTNVQNIQQELGDNIEQNIIAEQEVARDEVSQPDVNQEIIKIEREVEKNIEETTPLVRQNIEQNVANVASVSTPFQPSEAEPNVVSDLPVPESEAKITDTSLSSTVSGLPTLPGLQLSQGPSGSLDEAERRVEPNVAPSELDKTSVSPAVGSPETSIPASPDINISSNSETLESISSEREEPDTEVRGLEPSSTDLTEGPATLPELPGESESVPQTIGTDADLAETPTIEPTQVEDQLDIPETPAGSSDETGDFGGQPQTASQTQPTLQQDNEDLRRWMTEVMSRINQNDFTTEDVNSTGITEQEIVDIVMKITNEKVDEIG